MNLLKVGDYFQTDSYSVIDILTAIAALGAGIIVIMHNSQGMVVTIVLFGIFAVASRMRSNIPLLLALICAVSMPFAQILGLQLLLEELAICMFFFLAISISLAALEIQPHRERKVAAMQMWDKKPDIRQQPYAPPTAPSPVKTKSSKVITPTEPKELPQQRPSRVHKVKRRTTPNGVIDPVFSAKP